MSMIRASSYHQVMHKMSTWLSTSSNCRIEGGRGASELLKLELFPPITIWTKNESIRKKDAGLLGAVRMADRVSGATGEGTSPLSSVFGESGGGVHSKP